MKATTKLAGVPAGTVDRHDGATSTRMQLAMLFFLGLCVAVSASGAADATFSEIVDKLVAWITGSLGIACALGSFVVGLVIGIVRQSLMAAVVGVGIALAASVGPGVITGIFTATL